MTGMNSEAERRQPLLEQLDQIERQVERLGEQRDNALTLLEHAQRELALALIRIEELEGKDDVDAEEREARDA